MLNTVLPSTFVSCTAHMVPEEDEEGKKEKEPDFSCYHIVVGSGKSRQGAAGDKQHRENKVKQQKRDRLTDDDRVVVGDEHLAVDVDELRDQASLQLGVSPQASEGDVLHPLVVHWDAEERNNVITSLNQNSSCHSFCLHLLSFFSWEMMEYSPLIMVLQRQDT